MTVIPGRQHRILSPIFSRRKIERPDECAAAPDRTTIDQAIVRGLATELPRV